MDEESKLKIDQEETEKQRQDSAHTTDTKPSHDIMETQKDLQSPKQLILQQEQNYQSSTKIIRDNEESSYMEESSIIGFETAQEIEKLLISESFVKEEEIEKELKICTVSELQDDNKLKKYETSFEVKELKVVGTDMISDIHDINEFVIISKEDIEAKQMSKITEYQEHKKLKEMIIIQPLKTTMLLLKLWI